MNKNKIVVGIFVLLGMCLLLSTVSAFEDTFQQDTVGQDPPSTYWNWNDIEDVTEGIRSVYAPLYQQYMDGAGHTDCHIEQIFPEETNYVSFKAGYVGHGGNICFYNESDYLMVRISLPITSSNNLYEFVRLNNYLYYFRDGVNMDETPPVCNYPIYYVVFEGCTFDDYSDEDGYVVDLAEYENDHTAVEFDESTINVGYTTNQYYDKDSDFDMKVKRLSTGEIVNSKTLSNPAGLVTYNRTEVLGYNYGFYLWEVTCDGAVKDFDYLFYVSPGESSWVNFDEDMYCEGQKAAIEYYIGDANFDEYYYWLWIADEDNNQQAYISLTAQSGTKYWDTTDVETGRYFVLLKASEKSGGDTSELAYDECNVHKQVWIEGTTYNARTGEVLGDVNVHFKQGSALSYSTTSNATTGEYQLTGLISEIETTANASKAGFTHNDFTFTPPTTGVYHVDLYLMPTDLPFSVIGGVVQSYPFHQAISNATVNIWSGGWSNTTTTSNWGYYEFANISWNTTTVTNETFNSSEYDTWVTLNHTHIKTNSEKVTNTTDEVAFIQNTDYEMNFTDGKIKVLSTGNMLNNTSYHIDYDYNINSNFYMNATAQHYTPSDTEYVIANVGSYTKQNFLLRPIYNLFVKVVDEETEAPLNTFTTYINNENEKNTTTGMVTYDNLSWGYYQVKAVAEGYYPGYDYVLLQNDTMIEIELTRLGGAEGGAGVYYPPPHLVEFRVVSITGKPYSDVSVSAVGIQTTMGAWSWLQDIFGYKSETHIHNTSMNGTTGDQGAINFLMVETIKYQITFSKPEQGINKTMYIYPKESQYLIMITPTTEPSLIDYVTWNLSVEYIDSSNSSLNLSYIDTLNRTSTLTFFVWDINKSELYNKTFIYNDTIEIGYNVSNSVGNTFYWGFDATHTDFGVLGQVKAITFKGLLIDLGIENKAYYNWISIAILFLFGTFFSYVTNKFGYVIIPLFAGFFYWIRWLDVSVLIITTAIIIGILSYMGRKEREAGL